MSENHLMNRHDGNMMLILVSCISVRKVTASSSSTQIWVFFTLSHMIHVRHYLFTQSVFNFYTSDHRKHFFFPVSAFLFNVQIKNRWMETHLLLMTQDCSLKKCSLSNPNHSIIKSVLPSLSPYFPLTMTLPLSPGPPQPSPSPSLSVVFSPVCCCVKCKTDWALPPVRQTLQSEQSREKQIFLWEQRLRAAASDTSEFLYKQLRLSSESLLSRFSLNDDEVQDWQLV